MFIIKFIIFFYLFVYIKHYLLYLQKKTHNTIVHNIARELLGIKRILQYFWNFMLKTMRLNLRKHTNI